MSALARLNGLVGWVLLVAGLVGCAPSAPATSSPVGGGAAPSPSVVATQPVLQPTAQAPAAAEDAVAAFYHGKTVRLIVGSEPGGGYDLYSRVIARHMNRFIPGSPTVIVENMPGAGSLLAWNTIYNSAPRDGTVIGNASGGLLIQQLFGTAGINFDATKMDYLGIPNSYLYVLVVTRAAGVQKLGDILGPSGKPVVIAAIPNGAPEQAAIMLRDLLGANVKIVNGYQTTAKVLLAAEGGEVDAFQTDWFSIKALAREKVQSGDWTILAQWADTPSRELPDVPSMLSFAKTQDQRQLMRFGLVSPNQINRLYMLPPGVPADRSLALTTAFSQTLQDPQFLADAAQAKLDIGLIPGAETRKLVQEFLGMGPDMKERLRKLLGSA